MYKQYVRKDRQGIVIKAIEVTKDNYNQLLEKNVNIQIGDYLMDCGIGMDGRVFKGRFKPIGDDIEK